MNERPSQAQTSTAGQVAEVLREFARVLDADALSRQDLAASLFLLARFLRRYPEINMSELVDGLTWREARSHRLPSPRERLKDRLDLSSIDLAAVRNLVDSDELSKGDLLDLASERFGISRSRLLRQSRTAIASAIHAAVNNQESLEIIGQEAARVGSERSG